MSRIEPQEAEERLTEIRERAAAIIPGPWAWMGNTATDQVYLGTTDRGRLIVLTPDLRAEQYVYDHDEMEIYDLKDARTNAEARWCFNHGHRVDPDDTGPCICDELGDWLRGDLDLEAGPRHFSRDERGYSVDLVRGVLVRSDLSFVTKEDGDIYDYRQHGGVIRSHRDRVKYEVLGYRTVTEWEMDQGGVVPPAGGDIRDHLYREDFVGIDTPEADFIANSAGDVAWLLSYIADLEEQVHAAN